MGTAGKMRQGQGGRTGKETAAFLYKSRGSRAFKIYVTVYLLTVQTNCKRVLITVIIFEAGPGLGGGKQDTWIQTSGGSVSGSSPGTYLTPRV